MKFFPLLFLLLRELEVKERRERVFAFAPFNARTGLRSCFKLSCSSSGCQGVTGRSGSSWRQLGQASQRRGTLFTTEHTSTLPLPPSPRSTLASYNFLKYFSSQIVLLKVIQDLECKVIHPPPPNVFSPARCKHSPLNYLEDQKSDHILQKQ